MARRTFGSIRKLPSGRFQARYRVGDEWVNAPYTFDLKRNADDWLAETQTDMARGRWIDPRNLGTVADIIEAYISSRAGDAEKPLSPDTATLYRRTLRLGIEPYRIADMPASSVRVRSVHSWWDSVTTEQPLSQAKQAYKLLRASFGWLLDQELVSANPCRIKGAGANLPARTRVAGDGELERILEHLDKRWHVLVLLAAWVGPRWGELRGLTRSDVDLDHGLVRIDDQLRASGHRDATKTGTAMVVHIPPHLLPYVGEHLETYVDEGDDALVFTGFRGGPLSASLFGKHWRAAQEEAEVPRLRFHDLRRTAGTWATEKGGASLAGVMRRLGHKTVAAAMTYQSPGLAEDRAVAERLSLAASGGA